MTRIPMFVACAIQTNWRCNLRCPFCFHGQDDGYGGDDLLDTGVIRGIFDDLAGMGYTGRVSLYNLNEPLTDPRLPRLVAEARRRLPRCTHTLSTNGVLLTQPLLDDLTKHLDRLRINRYTSIPDLDYTHGSIEISDKRGFYCRAASNRGGNLRNLPAAAGPAGGPCANPFAQMVIMPPGEVVLCCSDGYKRVRLGDVRRRSLLAIWTGDGFTEIRKALAGGRRSELPLCRSCSVAGGGFFEYFQDPSRYDRRVDAYRTLDPQRERP